MKFIEPPGGRPWALLGLCGSSLLLNLVLLVKINSVPDPAMGVEVIAATTAVTMGDTTAAVDGNPESVAMVATEMSRSPATQAPAVEPAPPPVPAGVEFIEASVEHSLARTFSHGLPSDRANIAAAVYTRLFFWELDPARDLQRGDTVRMAYTWDGSMVDIPAASLTSGKLGRTLTAYQFHATGDDWPSFWDDEGREIAHRLKDGPLLTYQQITSRLKDRPGHKGMDFKVPTGTDVMNPKAGSVLRTNWNIKYNGNCVEVKYDDGTLARFLHLSRTDVKAGDRVGKGARLGLSGNTGRSTAPHLHYELERGGSVLDPIAYHGTVRRALSDGDMSRFGSVRTQWSATLLPR